jgi:hypothetical protein
MWLAFKRKSPPFFGVSFLALLISLVQFSLKPEFNVVAPCSKCIFRVRSVHPSSGYGDLPAASSIRCPMRRNASE